MANTKKFVVKNGLHTQNVDFVSPDENSTLTLSMLDSDTISISGDTGQLFSITDSQTGTIFAVNDVSGVSSIEVLDNGTIRLAELFGDVAIGKSTPQDKLDVEGNVRIGATGVDATLTTNGAADLILTTNAGSSSGYIRIYDGADGDIAIEPEDAGNVNLITDTLRLGSTNENVTVTTLGTGDLTLNTNAGSNSGNIKIFDGANNNIELQVNGTGTVVVNEAAGTADFRVEGNADQNLLFVDGSANRVGIGTNSPTAKLNVEGGGVIINDAGNDVDVRIESDADENLFFTDGGNNRVGIGLSAPATKLHIQQTTATTNAVTDVLRLDSQSSDTPAVGIGVGMEFAVETAAGNTEVGATIEAVVTDITATSEDFDLVFRTMIAGAAVAQVGKLNNNTLQIGATGVNTVLTTLGTADLTLNTNSGTNSGTIVIADGVNQNISIEPNGTGDLVIYTDTVAIGGNSASPSAAEDVTITTRNASDLTLNTNSGTNSGSIKIFDGANNDISIEPNGTGDLVIYTDTVAIGGNSASPSAAEDVVVTTRNASDLTLSTNAGSNSGNIKIFDGANNNIELQVNGTGVVVVNEAGNAADFRVEGDTLQNLLFVDGSADRIGINTSTPTATLNVEGAVIINDGGADVDVRIEGDADQNLFFTDAGNDRVGIGLNVPATKLHIQQASATTNAVTDVLRLDFQSTGTPANGIGVGLEFAVETTANNTEVGAAIEAVVTDVTATSEDFDLIFRTMIAGAAAAQVGKLNNNTLQVGANATATTILTQGNSNLTLKTGSTNSGTIVIANGDNQNITLTPHGTGRVDAAGNVTLGASSSNTLNVNALVNTHLLFTDATYDIGASGATRPRDLYLSGSATIGGAASIGTNLTVTGNLTVNGNTTLGNANSDTVTANASMANGTAWRTTTTSANTFHLSAYDNDNTTYRNLVTLTAGNIPNISIGGVSGATSNITATVLKRSGDVSATNGVWADNTGVAVTFESSTFTNTTSSGAQTGVKPAISFNAPTFASTTSTTLITGATLYVENPVAGTNTTITNRYAIYNAGNEFIGGSLTVNGDAVFLSQSLSLNGKTVVVGNVTAKTGVTATAITSAGGTGPYTATLTGVSTEISPGQVLTKTSGTGAFGTNTRVLLVTGSVGAYTVSVEADTAFTNGTSIVFDVSGPTDYSANEGGLILKGNGDKSILWIDSTDSWTFNQNIETSGRVKTGNYVQDGTLTASLTTTSQTVVDTSATASIKSTKYIIQASRGSEYQYSEIMMVTDGSNAFLTEYANVYTGVDALVSYDADVSGGNMRLLATAVTATTSLKILKTYVV